MSSASSAQLLSRPPFSNGPNRSCRWRASSSACATCIPPSHWALTGTPPAYDTPDEDVYLHGRNIALLSKAAVYAASRKISRLVVAPLAGNPFPDATPQFFAALNAALSLGLAAPIEISAPFAHLHKEDVVKIGARARRAVRADALVHEPVGHDALRAVQQVPRAARRIPRRGHHGPDDLRQRQPQIDALSQTLKTRETQSNLVWPQRRVEILRQLRIRIARTGRRPWAAASAPSVRDLDARRVSKMPGGMRRAHS